MAFFFLRRIVLWWYVCTYDRLIPRTIVLTIRELLVILVSHYIRVLMMYDTYCCLHLSIIISSLLIAAQKMLCHVGFLNTPI